MKIQLENEEELIVDVPVTLGSSTRIVVQSAAPEPIQRLVTVVVEDGLIGNVSEHVVRRHADAVRVEDRLVLWGHLVSAHAGIFPLHMTIEELIDMHEHEHNGPGTISNHPRESRHHSLHRIGEVLTEAEPEDDAP